MINVIKNLELQEKGLFIREPIDEINKKIISDNSKKIIVTGGRGTGKSVLLHNQELRNLGNYKQTICIKFDSVALFPEQFDEQYDKRFIEHYYEMILCRKILNYIKTNYPIIYEKQFKGYKEMLDEISKKTDYYINNAWYQKVILDIYLRQNELSDAIILNMRRVLNIESVSLAIDRFDWTNESNCLVQEIISNYFVQFDKAIITTDDKTLEDKDNRKELIDKGYSFIDLEYGKNKEIATHIVRNRLNYINAHLRKVKIYFPEEILDDHILEYLIKKANGNISFIIDCVNDIISHWEFSKQSLTDKKLEAIVGEQLVKKQQLEEMSKTIKLYL